jgi:hypothetical protein
MRPSITDDADDPRGWLGAEARPRLGSDLVARTTPAANDITSVVGVGGHRAELIEAEVPAAVCAGHFLDSLPDFKLGSVDTLHGPSYARSMPARNSVAQVQAKI